MADGDVLTKVAGHQAFAAPTGGVQTVRLLGPYHVEFDAPGIDDNVLLDTLDAGTWVFGVAVITITDSGGSEGAIDVNVSIEGYKGWRTTDIGALGQTGAAPGVLSMSPGAATFVPVATGNVPGGLYFSYFTENPLTQGEWDIYALVASAG